MKRTPLKRQWMKRRPVKREGVSGDLHQRVFARDGICFLARLSPDHVCSGPLTLDHVHLDGGHMGKRAPDDEQHLVLLCRDPNVKGVSAEVRQAQREYLLGLYPEAA
jgi:hypothetical protein